MISGDLNRAQDDMKPASKFPKQAVVVIHGMGEQMPMDTIKRFVRAVWETDTVITANGLPNPAEVWSKPDVHGIARTTSYHDAAKYLDQDNSSRCAVGFL